MNKTYILLALAIFGAACFGGGVLFGQHLLTSAGFVYAEGAATAETAVSSGEDDGKVDINTATVAELTAVDGIGNVTAAKIVAGREDGAYKEVSELLDRGIVGKAKWEEIRASLKVD